MVWRSKSVVWGDTKEEAISRAKRYGKANSGRPTEETKKVTKQFAESVAEQEKREQQFSEFLKKGEQVPHLSKYLPLAKYRRPVTESIYRTGSGAVGTIHRIGMGTEEARAQAKYRKRETIETAINIGLPIVSRGISYVRKPSTVEFIGAKKGEVSGGVGVVTRARLKPLEPFVEPTKRFIFAQKEIGKVNIPEGQVSASRGVVATSVKDVSKQESIAISKQIAEKEGITLFEQGAITKTDSGYSGAISGGIQRGEFTAVGGVTTEGVRFRGIIKDIPKTTKGGVSTQQTTQQARQIGEQVTKAVTPNKIKTAPVPKAQSIQGTYYKSMSVTAQQPIQYTQTKNITTPTFKEETRVSRKVIQKSNTSSQTRPRHQQDIAEQPQLKPRQAEGLRIDERQAEKQETKLFSKQLQTQGKTVNPITPIPKVAIFGGTPTFKFKIEPEFRRRIKKVKSKQPKRYTPSGYSATFGIKGKKHRLGTTSGLGVRPI